MLLFIAFLMTLVLILFMVVVTDQQVVDKISECTASHWTASGEPIFADPSHNLTVNSAGNWQCLPCGGQTACDASALDAPCVPRTKLDSGR